MLTEMEVERLFAQLQLPESTRDLVRKVRADGPVREPNNRLGNSNVWFFSRKMGSKHLRLESRTVEGVAAILYENDNNILEYWPQPVTVDLILTDKDGTNTGRTTHTPDFLLIQKNGIRLIEWREESRLLAAAKKENNKFCKDDANRWHYRPAEVKFRAMGLEHELHSAIELPHKLADNYRFLADYYRPDCLPVDIEIEKRLSTLLNQNDNVPFFDLIETHHFTADDIFKSIAQGIAYVNLENDRLDTPGELIIYKSSIIARLHKALVSTPEETLPFPGMSRRIAIGTLISYQGKTFKVILVGGSDVLLRNPQGDKITLPIDDVASMLQVGVTINGNSNKPSNNVERSITIADVPPVALELALVKFEAIESKSPEIPARTLRRWKSATSNPTSRLEKVLALVNKDHLKGNRESRLPSETEDLAVDTIKIFYNTPEGRTMSATFHQYKVICKANQVTPMGFTAFCRRINALSSTRDREGKRKAYHDSPIPLHLDYRSPVHGVRPHEVCYVDHTILNIATTGTNGSDLGKPVFTLITDGGTFQTRAIYLSYDPPSTRVVLMSLRDYVRRHNRLPAVLVVDGGKEFRSKELEFFCALFGIDLRHRPPGQPRAGSPVERGMGIIETELLAQLEGNTRIMKNARMVTKSVNPFERRKWTLVALWGVVNEFLFDIKNNRIHPAIGITPMDYEARRYAETGARDHVLIPFDENIMLATCPHATNRFRTIDRQRGVWADGTYYWHDNFRHAGNKDKVEVRIEPWNANVIYVFYGKKWLPAIARDLRRNAGRTSYEVELALRTERRDSRTKASSARLGVSNAQRMTDLWDPKRFDPRIHEQQKEMASLFENINMGPALRVPNIDKNIVYKPATPQAAPTKETKTRKTALRSDNSISTPLSESQKYYSQNFDIWTGNDEFV